MHVFRAAVLISLTATVAGAAEPSGGFPKTSPFVPAATANAPAEMAAERIEFAGVSVMGKQTDFIFYDKTTKKSHWLAKGETKEGISVLNYDDERDQVVVKLNGAEKTLSLRKATKSAVTPRPVPPMATGFNVASSPVAAPAVAQPVAIASGPAAAADPAPTHSAPTAPAAPETTQQKQETEARMLVSDLLEIGMAQRKAYEEAQRKSSEGNGNSTTPATPPPASNPTQPTGR